MTKNYSWMIYGATGRSGELIARRAVARGLRPILAGRNERAVRKIAEELHLSWRAFEVGDWDRFKREMSRVNLLVNAAGPLTQTSVLVAEACLAAHTHYFDLTNQVPSLVGIYTLDAEAKEKNLTLLPGLALSPAASNCLVKHLHTLLPNADAVDIVLDPFMQPPTPGASLTIEENIAQGGFRRRDGVLEGNWFGNGLVEMLLPTGTRPMLPSALGDTEAAYRCTNLPNIAAYIVADTPLVSRDVARTRNPSAAQSPSAKSGATDSGNEDRCDHPGGKQSLVWARISKLGQSSLEGWLQFGDGYDFTAAAVIAGISRFLDTGPLSTGAHTPATALGTDFILSLPNVKRTVRTPTQTMT